MDKEIIFFENFVNQFDKNNKKIKHKYDHTYRVVEYAKKIAKSINLNEKEYNRAIICALFHDLGRFPQIKEYNTFTDLLSFAVDAVHVALPSGAVLPVFVVLFPRFVIGLFDGAVYAAFPSNAILFVPNDVAIEFWAATVVDSNVVPVSVAIL